MSGPAAASKRAPRAAVAVLPLLWLAFGTGCRGSGATRSYAVASGGDAAQGRTAILSRHCGACHDIPGVVGAYGVVGPPLAAFGERTFVAGILPNTPSNLVRWLREPLAIEPLTAMPSLGLSEAEARDVSAYLYTLR